MSVCYYFYKQHSLKTQTSVLPTFDTEHLSRKKFLVTISISNGIAIMPELQFIVFTIAKYSIALRQVYLNNFIVSF